eukprot:TRINITY_DN691_c0_g6_i1.p1 TRINITY_DN691_c0_g6~~TRINITY_DN691_c0_g6_i1.p1  ORF type:complete len:505 (-),score=101.29 TRINITY_DN691_c0_g6_i1:207-1721(-)
MESDGEGLPLCINRGGSSEDELLGADNKPHETYGSKIGYCFAINYVLGVGVLSIPYAFFITGILFGSLLLTFVSLLSALTCTWVLEAMSRAEAIKSADPTCRVKTERKFELNMLSELFMGKWAAKVYLLCIWLYMTGALVSYASVFAQSLAAHVPMWVGHGEWYTCDIYSTDSWKCNGVYWIYLAIFAFICLPLTMRDLTEQKILQFVLTACRFIAIILMSTLIIIAIYTDRYSVSRHEKDSFPRSDNPPYHKFTGLFKMGGLATAFPILLYSQCVHHSIPGLSQPIRNKQSLKKIFMWQFVSTFSLYLILAVPLAIYYGKYAEPTCTLNFVFYRAGHTFAESIPWWVDVIVFAIILFPPLDVVSAYPLNAITLANNMMTLFHSSKTPSSSSHEERTSKASKIAFRFLAAVPPFLISAVMKRLDVILKYTGVAGFFIFLFFPAALQLSSLKKYKEAFGERARKSPYSTSFLSHPIVVIASIAFGVCAFCFSVFSFFDSKDAGSI